MIGAGIFALLGEAGAVAGAAVWLSFLIGGVVALLLGYVCVKLGTRYPSSGGLITYLVEGFGRGRLVGIASWLGYIAAVVIVISMVAVSFGSYATALFVGNSAASWWHHLFITLLILAAVGLNMTGAKFVALAQSVIVLGVLVVFSALHLGDGQGRRLLEARLQRLPVGREDPRERRADLFRLPRLQRDHVRGRRPPEAEARPAARHVPGPRRHDDRVRPDLDRRLRHAHRRAGRPVRRTGDSRGGASRARRRRLHDHGRRRAALDRRRDERDVLRVGQSDLDARGGRTVSGVLRGGLTARQEGGAPDHGWSRAADREPRRPVGDRVRGECGRADGLPPRRRWRVIGFGAKRAAVPGLSWRRSA